MDLKSVLEDSINEIVVIKSNLINFANGNDNNMKNDINLKTTEEENNIDKEEESDIYLKFSEEDEILKHELITIPIVDQIDDDKCQEVNQPVENSSLYLCPEKECDKSYKKVVGESGLMRHLTDDHGFQIEDLKCPMCSRILSCRESLFLHIKKKHDQNLDLQCKICLKEFTMNQTYHKHMKNIHGMGKKKKGQNTILGCAACSFVTNSEEEMVRHKFEEHGIERKTKKFYNSVACEFCGFSSENVDRDQHILENHVTDGKYHCPKCNFISEDEAGLQDHFNTEHTVKSSLYICPDIDCGIQFGTVRGSHGFLKHMETGHNFSFDDLKCPICLKKYGSRDSLIYHINDSHDSNSDLECKKCFKTFISNYTLKHHMLHQHSNLVEPLLCDACEFTTKSQTSLKRHKAKEHSTEGKQFSCPQCPKQFYIKLDMTTHVKDAHAEKNYLCSQCEFSTRLKGNLNRHIETMHGSQERKFSCHVCGNNFKTEKDLRNHLECHSTDKKYKCDYCGKAFATNKYLHKHLAIHEGKYRGHCTTCDLKFVQFSNYKLHMLKHHQIKVSPNQTKDMVNSV